MVRSVKKLSILVIACLLLSCNGVGLNSIDGQEINLPIEDVIGGEIDPSTSLASIPLEIESDASYEGYSSREWSVKGDFIDINADLTGDGRLDYLRLNFVYMPTEKPNISFGRKGHILTWPFEIVENIKLGDVDKDGDVDIVIQGPAVEHFLVNKVEPFKKLELTDSDFEIILQEIGEYIRGGDIISAYMLAFDIALGTPHSWTVPGEGELGLYDKDPIVELDVGNCVTWVEQILAMLNSSGNMNLFLDTLINIRYLEGSLNYFMRNHFQSVDWIPNNINAGYISDVTNTVFSDVAKKVQAKINKKRWYEAKSSLEGDFSGLTDEEKEERVEQLQALGAFTPVQEVSLAYVPFETMVDDLGISYRLSPNFVSRLPEVTIFNIVNEGFQIMGSDDEWMTDLVVTHTGFIVKDSEGHVTVYHSTNKTDAGLGIMAEEDFLSFLERRFLNNPDTKSVGLHLSKPTVRVSSAFNSMKNLF